MGFNSDKLAESWRKYNNIQGPTCTPYGTLSLKFKNIFHSS